MGPQTVFSQTAKPLRTQDSVRVSKGDTIVKPKTRSDFKSTVRYHAKDSIRFDVPSSIIRLYGDATIDYEDMNIKAAQIEIDYKNNVVHASGVPDSTGKIVGKPVFKQGDSNYETDKMSYNFKSQKGLIMGVVTKQGEGYVQGERIKKSPENELYIDHATYTTCDRLHPHFAFHATKIKVIPGDRIISSAGNLSLGAVPTPLVFPFGFFPFPTKRSSGILMPSFSESSTSGFYLEKLGFYWAANPYLGVTTKWDIYSNGGFITNNIVDYYKRYAARGTFSFIYSALQTGFGETKRGTPHTGQVIWSHYPIGKGTGKLSASVNMGFSNFNRNTSSDAQNYANNTFASNVNYTKSFAGTPFSFAISARQNQNVTTKAFNMELPNVNFAMNQQRPLQNFGKSSGWYRTLNFAYNATYNNMYNNTTNSFASPVTGIRFVGWNDVNGNIDTSLIFTRTKIDSNLTHTFDQKNMGMQHTIPISASMKVFKHFSLNPSLNISSIWYFRELEYSAVDYQTVKVRYVDKFSTINTYNANLSLTTNVYGTMQLKGRIQAIRHLMQPTFTFTYAPDLSKSSYFANLPNPQNTSTDQRDPVYLSKYAGAGFIYGAPIGGASNILAFNLKNSLEMKVKTKKDTTQKSKKVSLIDNLIINGNYNFAARGDTNKLSPINVTLGTNILKIFNVNFLTTLDPYLYKSTLRDQNTGEVTSQSVTQHFLYDTTNGKKLAHVSSMNVSLSMILNPKARKKQAEQFSPAMLEYYRRYPNQRYIDFSIPWNASASFNYSYNQTGLMKATETTVISTTADVKLTQNLRFGITNLGYDFTKEAMVLPQIAIFRDLHCWVMTFNWSPFSQYQTYSFNINVKASSLQDLKIPKRGNQY